MSKPLAELVQSTFNAARESGAVVFTESERVKTIKNGVQYLFTFAPALAKKPPKEQYHTTETIDPRKLKKSPWDPVEPGLLIDGDFENDYRLVLNKFAIVPRHFLMVTKEIKPQTAPLSPEDLAAAYKALFEVNKEKRHIGFFNCGEQSGASVAHKHIQFMEFPEDFTPYVDQLMELSQDYKEGQRPFTDTRMPFAHFVVPIPPSPDADSLAFRYSTLMSRVLTALRKEDLPTNYNFIFSENWMMGVPRRQEKYEGRSINSVGMVGMLLAKTHEDLEFFKQAGPDSVLAALGLPTVDIEQHEDEYDY